MDMQFRIKSIDQWFTEYGESHRNTTNKAIHWICVPLITYTLLGLLWALSPYALLVFSIVALVFYLTLSMLMSLHAVGGDFHGLELHIVFT